MNGLFGQVQLSQPQAVHPDVAAAMGQEMNPQQYQQQMPQQMTQQQMPNQAMQGQAALDEYMAQQAQQPKYKHTVGHPELDRYINMFLPQGD